MVHNGIEYGDMQLIAEGATFARAVGGLAPPQLSDLLRSYAEGAAWRSRVEEGRRSLACEAGVALLRRTAGRVPDGDLVATLLKERRCARQRGGAARRRDPRLVRLEGDRQVDRAAGGGAGRSLRHDGGRTRGEIQPRSSRDPAEIQPRCSRDWGGRRAGGGRCASAAVSLSRRWTFSEPSPNLLGTFSEPSPNLLRTFSEPSPNLLGTFSEPSRSPLGALPSPQARFLSSLKEQRVAAEAITPAPRPSAKAAET